MPQTTFSCASNHLFLYLYHLFLYLSPLQPSKHEAYKALKNKIKNKKKTRKKRNAVTDGLKRRLFVGLERWCGKRSAPVHTVLLVVRRWNAAYREDRGSLTQHAVVIYTRGRGRLTTIEVVYWEPERSKDWLIRGGVLPDLLSTAIIRVTLMLRHQKAKNLLERKTERFKAS